MASSATIEDAEKMTGPETDSETGNPGISHGDVEVLCGPLLNYKGMSNPGTPLAKWHGSVLLVTNSGHGTPELSIGPENLSSLSKYERQYTLGLQLYEDSVKVYWRFDIGVPVSDRETNWGYTIANLATPGCWTSVVPSISQSMRIMFHSCNGFSTGTDNEGRSGPALWKDVMRMHEGKPFHVMIGGGDHIYNDGVQVSNSPLREWISLGDAKKQRKYAFDEQLQVACDDFYCDSYIELYSKETFRLVHSQIPQINIWDDHGIIDGFGSYADHFMKCPVFRGIGDVAFKYYCLFQHHISPPGSLDSVSTQSQTVAAKNLDPRNDDCFIIGGRSGPYINGCSRSLYLRLGARVAFLGIDARTERTEDRINYADTYNRIFARMEQELDSPGPRGITHLIVLLGVPIAYPRPSWHKNYFRSFTKRPIEFLREQFGVGGGLVKKVARQDHLDDLYTARQHKPERKWLITRLQELAQGKNVRITILGGNVHLAAVGRFYVNPKDDISSEYDYRYMCNVISSAIMIRPPPRSIAEAVAGRNKMHHLDSKTDETLLTIWDKDTGDVEEDSLTKEVVMPKRNYVILSESQRLGSYSLATHSNATKLLAKRDGRFPLHDGEETAGLKHRASDGMYVGVGDGALDVCFRVEIDQENHEGNTKGYGFHIPALQIVDLPRDTDIMTKP